MQFSTVFLSLLAATAVVAKGNSTKPLTDKSLCKEMNKLEKLVDQAQNTTKLASKTNNNQTTIDSIMAKASAAAVQLDAMQANTTLVSTCAVIDAAQTTKKQCNKMEDLQKTIATAAKTKGNATIEAEYQAKAAKAQTKLAEMTSNTTLVDACSALQTEKEAKQADTTTTSAATSSTAASGAAGLVGAKLGSLVGAGVLVAVGMILL
ncbi:uncharacterized protein EAF02_006739 [Botrytis sinoallii]|uniref:uncharacterized protein n=1 Tax=Botrytis sinoallii TaxID=1463999 RepID=UPI001900E8A5|nr:uncharacterized protein EAF02_006739 [Botrytis sinoallii]KAF7880848.1 hypothetical protein EAF02_006739 [Botrytis sinoallii]